MNKPSSVVKVWSILLMLHVLALAVACDGGGGGSSGSSSGVSGTYAARVANYKANYGKSDEWEDWMIANNSRYQATFAASSAKPDTITISFRYETVPINYAPPWASEAEHMSVFTTMAQGAYPGYNFNIVFGGNTSSSYANIIAGLATNSSYTSGKNVYLYYETIFNHEFGHVMKLLHHYDSVAQIGDGLHMPPGDTQCIMDRTSTMFCSACRTALGIPLDITDTTDMDNAMADILSRYPY
jgi:predicted Zn-dependent protease